MDRSAHLRQSAQSADRSREKAQKRSCLLISHSTRTIQLASLVKSSGATNQKPPRFYTAWPTSVRFSYFEQIRHKVQQPVPLVRRARRASRAPATEIKVSGEAVRKSQGCCRAAREGARRYGRKNCMFRRVASCGENKKGRSKVPPIEAHMRGIEREDVVSCSSSR